MTYQNGWSLIQTSSGIEVERWLGTSYGHCPEQPSILRLPNGDHVHCPSVDVDYSGYKLVASYSDDEPPDPGLTKPHMIAAAFNIVISDGDIQGIGGAFNLIGALYLDVGQYMLMFLKPEPDTNYVAQVIDGGMNIKVTDKGADYMTIEAKDGNGAYADPSQFGIQVYRFS